jgi:hypothetical protein
MFLKFLKFVESYLKSNDAPLYHFTSSFVLNEILLSNKITVGYYKNPYLKDFFYFVSLTRTKNFENYRTANLSIELNKDKLKNNYKIVPYDYFIHSKMEKYPKSNINRIKEYEFEEIILNDIENLNKYISAIFSDLNNYFNYKRCIEGNLLLELVHFYFNNIFGFILNLSFSQFFKWFSI